MTIQIHRLLQKTEQEYEDMYIEQYMRWCMDFSINNLEDLQKVLANSALSNYYNTEFAKLENAFKIQMQRRFQTLRPISEEERQRLYEDCTFEMHNRYPKALLSNAKKLNIYNDPTAN